MTSSPTPSICDIPEEEHSLAELAYFQQRFRNRLHRAVLEEFMRQHREAGLTRAVLARRTHRKPEQITRWLGGPGNWTLDTVSDLLLGMNTELTVGVVDLTNLPRRNDRGPEWLPDTVTGNITAVASFGDLPTAAGPEQQQHVRLRPPAETTAQEDG